MQAKKIVYTCTYIHVYMYMYVCMYMYVYTHVTCTIMQAKKIAQWCAHEAFVRGAHELLLTQHICMYGVRVCVETNRQENCAMVCARSLHCCQQCLANRRLHDLYARCECERETERERATANWRVLDLCAG